MKTAAPTPAELADQLLGELEAEVLPRVEDEYGGQAVVEAVRNKRAELVERLQDARWKPGRTIVPEED